ncbi:MAG: glycosyltransferase [Acidimicrobiia bacterium]|nr:glycosyltransferase [Acidimicrobiia bacterium]
MSQRATIILPAFNEEEALPVVVDDIRSILGADADIVVVDDGSSDGTADAARRLGCSLVRHDQNRGKGAAIRSGVAVAAGDIVIVMDADATYPAATIPGMIDLLDDHDFVRAERRIDASNTPAINRVGNVLLGKALTSLHGLEPGDYLSGLYGARREVFESLGTEADGFDIEVEIGIKSRANDLRVATLLTDYNPRVGEKKLDPLVDGLGILARILRMVLLYRPLGLFAVPGLILLLVSIIGAIALSGGPVITGYLGLSIHTFIVAALGILAGFQLVVFGLAAALYRASLGFPPSVWLQRATSAPVRTTMAIAGGLLAVGAGIVLAVLITGWIASGGPEFTETRRLVLATTGFVFGLQLLSASMFLTLFRNHPTSTPIS